MNKNSALWVVIFVAISFCLLGLNFSTTSALPESNSLLPDQVSKAEIHGKAGNFDTATPIMLKLSMTKLPKLNEITEVICTVSTAVDAPNTTASILLPENAVVIDGSIEWNGHLSPGAPVSFSARIYFQSEGKKAIRALARHVIDERNSWGDIDAIYFTVGAERSFKGFYALESKDEIARTKAIPSTVSLLSQPTPVQPMVVDENKVSGEPPALVLAGRSSGQKLSQELAPLGNLTVTGRWSHYSRIGSLTPSRNFLVQLRRASDGAHLAFTYTDNNGNFSLGPVTNPGSAGIRVRIYTYVKYDSADPTDDELMLIPTGSTSAYANTFNGETLTYVLADGTGNVGAWEISRDFPEGTSPNAHAWYIKDDIDRGYRFPPDATGDCTAQWRFDSNDGTYYISGEHVHLKGEDRRSPDTIIHEMGHNVMYNAYSGAMPSPGDCPSPHYINGVSGIVCAWTEGWADFFPLAVNGDPFYTFSNGSSLDLENHTWGTPGWENGERVEGRVAGGLWDIYDSTNEGSDQISDGFTRIWRTFFDQNDNTLREYWNVLRTSGLSETAASNALLQNTIDMGTVGGSSSKTSDFDGDGKSDIAVFRPNGGTWYIQQSLFGFRAQPFGANGDRLVPGNYDGDGKTDVAVYRQGVWYISNSSNGAFIAQAFGTATDIPVPGRYDNDNRTDLAVFRPANGTWYVSRSSNGTLQTQQFGQNGDVPISGDFDGDGRTDFTVFRNGVWYIQQTTAGFISVSFGIGTDKPAPADYDGDGKTDIAVFRNGTWYIQRSQLGFTSISWGVSTDRPSPGDYDGDGKADVAVFRPSGGNWYILQSQSGTLRAQMFGANGDISVPGAYVP